MVDYIENSDIQEFGVRACKPTRTVTGYGGKLATPYIAKVGGRWRRVYAACYSNVAMHYITVAGRRRVLRWDDFPSLVDSD
jgi:hypothetical protein